MRPGFIATVFTLTGLSLATMATAITGVETKRIRGCREGSRDYVALEGRQPWRADRRGVGGSGDARHESARRRSSAAGTRDTRRGSGCCGRASARDANKATDAQLKAEILSYSRAKGLFAGVDLTGGVLRPDTRADHDLYGRSITAREILLDRRVRTPSAAQPSSPRCATSRVRPPQRVARRRIGEEDKVIVRFCTTCEGTMVVPSHLPRRLSQAVRSSVRRDRSETRCYPPPWSASSPADPCSTCSCHIRATPVDSCAHR